MKGRDRVLSMLDGAHDAVDRLPLLPITMMLAADTAGIPYRVYATDHNALADAQIKTARKYGLDHVSTISDPAREASDYGAAVQWFQDQPPALIEDQSLLMDKAKLRDLMMSPPDPLRIGSRMRDRIDGVAALRANVGDELAVEGWVEGPTAEACDLRGINRIMLDLYDDPEWLKQLLDFLVEQGLRFAKPQIDAGADWIGVGDASSSLVGPRLYKSLIQPAQQKLVDGLHSMGARVRLHICGNTNHIVTACGTQFVQCELVDLDSCVPLSHARTHLGAKPTLCGNVDPVRTLLNSTPAEITAAVAACHREAGPRFAVGAGCECPRGTPDSNMMAMCSYAFNHKPNSS
ncbi:uroporphyrinogen decarboxylase [Pelomyxa schiedti]|nr:uroporphyrinogen decarboxylase [Pelomyxa schiedti]